MACSAFGPIYWSAKDTDKTIAQVKEQNAAWKAVCSPSSPAKRSSVSTPAAKSAGTSFKDRWFEGVKTYATVFK